MKKIFILGTSLVALSACSLQKELNPETNTGTNAAIGFLMDDQNMTKATTAMQAAGHYNFGVFAYKNTDNDHPIMENYLVGYYDTTNGYGTEAGTTVGDQPGTENGKSYWMYEGMGYNQYTGNYAGTTIADAYKSNVDVQYLRYWDLSSNSTTFYAYAPYINGTHKGADKVVTYNNSTKKMTIPDGAIEHGYDNESLNEYMYATTKVEQANYKNDVALEFKRLNSKVTIKFWEDIAGYSVTMNDLKTDWGVSAAPAEGTAPNYTAGTIYEKSGVTITFNDGSENFDWASGTAATSALNFKTPDGQLGTERSGAVASATSYYAIPKTNDTGLTFHVSYTLTSTTGETIKVTDATVHVAKDFCQWEANKHYTYIFKITKNSNGTTATVDPNNIDPNDPKVSTETALYPIVFDNCTVVDWEDATLSGVPGEDFNITDDTQLNY